MKYVFLHIPKNGGTTLQSILDAQYRKFEVYNIPDPIRKEALERLKNKSNFSKSLIKVIKGGHFSFGCHLYFKNPDKVKYFAMLRHPLDRAVSYYQYVIRTPEHYLYNIFKNEKITFEKFITRSDLNMEVCNGQTKLIAGVDQTEFCSNQHFKVARLNLENSFFLVGIMEKYIETLYILQNLLKWKKPIEYNVKNVSNYKVFEINDYTKQRLIDMNEFDMLIYKEYFDKFEKKISALSSSKINDFKRKLK